MEHAKMNIGGIVKTDQVHRIGDEHCSHCLFFQDHRSIVIHPVRTDMTDEELAEEIRKQVKMMLRIYKVELL